ncbi:hypothetical protein SDRG_16647, partial [Saprolegnia diclina VS20]
MKKTWTMANSIKRQARCDTSMTTNGAVYLETVLRNIDFGIFYSCWGNGFDIGIGAELQLSSEGRAWLAMVSGATPQLSTSDEALYWRSFGLTSFETQWQNYKQLGVRNSYSIINAFGIAYPLTLVSQAGSYRRGSQTTYKMYWSLANDLSAVAMNTSGIGGLSLLRSSANYAFANTSLFNVYAINGTLASPLPPGSQLTTSLLGPFGSIDMVYVPPPPKVQQLMSTLLELTRAPLAGTLAVQAAYYNITPLDISYPVPGAWLALPYPASYGGSPLCPDITASRLMTAGLFAIVSYDAICLSASGTTARIQPTRQHYVLSALMAQLDSSTNMTRVCAHDVAYVLQCAVYLRSTVSYINSYVPQSEAVRASILDIRDTVRALDISFLLFFRDNASTPVLQLQ